MNENNKYVRFTKNLIKQLLDNNFSSKELESLANIVLIYAKTIKEFETWLEKSTPKMITEEEFKKLKK